MRKHFEEVGGIRKGKVLWLIVCFCMPTIFLLGTTNAAAESLPRQVYTIEARIRARQLLAFLAGSCW